jgi:hypothetical protein
VAALAWLTCAPFAVFFIFSVPPHDSGFQSAMEAFVSEHAREYHFDFTPEEGLREFEANGYSFFWLNVMDRYVSFLTSSPYLYDVLAPFHTGLPPCVLYCL